MIVCECWYKSFLPTNLSVHQLEHLRLCGQYRASQLADSFLTAIFTELLSQGLHLDEPFIINLQGLINLTLTQVYPSTFHIHHALTVQKLSSLLIRCIKQHNPSFNEASKSHSAFLCFISDTLRAAANDLKAEAPETPTKSKLPVTFGNYLTKFTHEFNQLPPNNTLLVITFLFDFLYQFVKGQSQTKWYHDALNSTTSKYLSTYRQYFFIFDLFTKFFASIPQQLTHYSVLSKKMFTLYFNWINKQFPSCLPSHSSDFQALLPKVVELTQALVNFGLQKDSGTSWTLSIDRDRGYLLCLSETLFLLCICVTKLKDYKLIDKEQTQQLHDLILQLLKVKSIFSERDDNVQTDSSQNTAFKSKLAFSTSSLINSLFVYQKPNFLRSCYEIRLKSVIFDSDEQRFKYTVKFSELAKELAYNGLLADSLEYPKQLI